jgi:hypothetical protein
VSKLIITVCFALLYVESALGQTNGAAAAHEQDKVTPFSFDGDVRDLPKGPPGFVQDKPYRPELKPGRPVEKGPYIPPPGQAPSPPAAPMPSATTSFAGLSFTDLCGGVQCGGGWPPDTNGDVGLNHYILAVNTAYDIYNKTGSLLASFTEDQLWTSGGTNPCNGDSQGDPIVVYDSLADRWILSHFAFGFKGRNPTSPFYQCIAVSKTSDPVSGGWWLYPIRMDPGGTGLPPTGAFGDYPKFGIWTDCLYMAANEFQASNSSFLGVSFASFSRTDMYSGNPLTFSLGYLAGNTTFTMIPSNLTAPLPTQLPAAGTPNYFVSESQTTFGIDVRKFTPGPNCGNGGVLGAAVTVGQASYDFADLGNVVPQPGTTTKLDSLDDRLLQKVHYSKVGSTESLWVVHSTRANASSNVQPQWEQIDVTGGVVNLTPVQQQIYAPDTTLYRWMGSLAVDSQGNMALGYSTSDGTTHYPSIAYSGRLVSDPLNTLPQTEIQLLAGAGAQTNTCGGAACSRWGDYSSMSLDPSDHCTFWYANEYYSSASNGTAGNWQTRIGSFKFPSCGGAVKKRRGQITSSN